ncbi:hypothetical protein [Vibrio comitans]|uniref:Uncharacterized protein n=1 Tax=Vibrio comitans NBRC 102076 TaxID=1219078 RepID=A0A4Y3IQ08_9VIBR|nr:hypothetical protein [Vibrio comitans]GEA61165.1 hypothetical protein VCO01S_23580 [Vibrio comitans NBRC 102076]
MNNLEKAKLAFQLFVVKDKEIELSVTERQKSIASEYYESIATLELIEQLMSEKTRV